MIRMRVKVKYIGPARVMLKKKEEDVEVSLKTTLSELLDKLANVYGEGFRNEVFEDDGKEVSKGLVVTVNGIAIGQLDGIQTKLREGDVVTLLPFLAGGG